MTFLVYPVAASKAFMVAVQQRVQSGSEADSVGGLADDLVGFICGTQTTADKLTHHSMQHHEKDGRTLCIHSVRRPTIRDAGWNVCILWPSRPQCLQGAPCRQPSIDNLTYISWAWWTGVRGKSSQEKGDCLSHAPRLCPHGSAHAPSSA